MTSPHPAYGGPTEPSLVDVPEPRRSERRPDGLLVDAAVIVGIFAVLGALAGVLWYLLAEPPTLTRYADPDGKPVLGQDEIQLTQVFRVDGWYIVVSAAAGLVAGAVLGRWRRRDPLATLLLVVVGCLAAAGLMELVGHTLGPGDPRTYLEAAKVGTTAEVPLTVHGVAAYLAWPLPAIIGVLVSLLTDSD